MVLVELGVDSVSFYKYGGGIMHWRGLLGRWG